MEWIYKVKEGLFSMDSKINLVFGDDRQIIRNLLKFDIQQNKGRNENEDSYNLPLSSNWIRLNFQNSKLNEIEILSGTVFVDNIEIIVEGNLTNTLNALKKKGFIFRKGDYSYTEFKNLFDIGDSEENGGKPNKISWFYTSTDFEHLR